jgi:predicted nucleic-acid-binding Zn-ribbon protein
MRNGKCPKCSSANVVPEMPLNGHEGVQPYVHIVEPEPPQRPFIWMPQSARSPFVAYVCGNCGYTEFYAVNFKSLGELHQKGFKAK